MYLFGGIVKQLLLKIKIKPWPLSVFFFFFFFLNVHYVLHKWSGQKENDA